MAETTKDYMFQCELAHSIVTFYANGTLVQRWSGPFEGKKDSVKYWKLENGAVMIAVDALNLNPWFRAVPELQAASEAWRAETEAEVNKEIVS